LGDHEKKQGAARDLITGIHNPYPSFKLTQSSFKKNLLAEASFVRHQASFFSKFKKNQF